MHGLHCRGIAASIGGFNMKAKEWLDLKRFTQRTHPLLGMPSNPTTFVLQTFL